MESKKKPLLIEVSPCKGDGKMVFFDLTGCLDAYTVADLEIAVHQQMLDGCNQIIMGMQKVDFTSSAGIGTLLRLIQKLQQKEGDLVLVSPNSHIFQVLEQLEFTRIFKFADSMNEARDLLRSR